MGRFRGGFVELLELEWKLWLADEGHDDDEMMVVVAVDVSYGCLVDSGVRYLGPD